MTKPTIMPGYFAGRATSMPSTWPDGTKRSSGGPFAVAYFVRGTPGTAQPPAKRGPKHGGLVLNTAGKAQASLARATVNNITIGPAKTVEQLCVSAIRESQINRPLRAAKREKVAA